MKQDFVQYYKREEKHLLGDIADIVSIESVASSSDGQDRPFGKGVSDCLHMILQKALNMGFDIKNIDNYVGEITLGKGNHLIGILCHADVVDAGEGWNTDPFTAVEIDGELYGRGVIDDKGPMVCCLYAMKYIMENDLLPDDCRIKMIIGTDEEENWESIKKYLNTFPELPKVSIVPDANFPIIFCEKGLMNFVLKVPIEADEGAALHLESLYGGERSNVVPTNAECRITLCDDSIVLNDLRQKLLQSANCLGISAEVIAADDGALIVKTFGRAAHAMTPGKGKNAISYLMEMLFELTKENLRFTQQNTINFFHKYIGTEYDGNLLGLSWHDEDSGDLTVNVGLMEINKHSLIMTVNLRYPVTKSFNEVNHVLEDISKNEHAELEYGVCMDPIYFKKNSKLINELLSVYQEVAGDYENEPIALGGATYARAIPNAVAFGPVFPNQEELAHEPNEHYTIRDFERITEIYAKALLRLCETK